MNLHQFRFIRAAVRQNYNLTEAAKSLYTSQPGISKAIIELEEELGIDIFTRHGKRIRGLTEPGRSVLKSVELIMQEVENLKRIGQEFSAHDSGSFIIATTHTQARYLLPDIINRFTKKYPKVRLSLLQGDPKQIIEMIRHDQADIAIATEIVAEDNDIVFLPCYKWKHIIVVLSNHPLLSLNKVSLEDLAKYPLVTYDTAFAGRKKIDYAFNLSKLQPKIILEAIDADVIKTYVEIGLGIGIISEIAFSNERDQNLRSISASHLFGTNISRVAIKKHSYLRRYVYTFLELLNSNLNYQSILKLIERKTLK